MERHQRVRRRLKLRQLEILLAVADTRSMAKAATRLAITQPAISRALADAEHTLGVPLFDRGTHGVEPTPYGRALLKRGIAAFDELDQGSGKSSFSPIRRRASSGSERPQVFPRELYSP
jgi:DNA-binding transcriptional LysR family regulator